MPKFFSFLTNQMGSGQYKKKGKGFPLSDEQLTTANPGQSGSSEIKCVFLLTTTRLPQFHTVLSQSTTHVFLEERVRKEQWVRLHHHICLTVSLSEPRWCCQSHRPLHPGKRPRGPLVNTQRPRQVGWRIRGENEMLCDKKRTTCKRKKRFKGLVESVKQQRGRQRLGRLNWQVNVVSKKNTKWLSESRKQKREDR